MNLPIYTTALLTFGFVINFVRATSVRLREQKAAAAGIEIDPEAELKRLRQQERMRQATSLGIVLAFYELLVGQTDYLAALCILTAIGAISVTVVQIAVAGRPPIKRDTKAPKAAIVLGCLHLITGILGLAAVIGTIGGVIAYYI